MQVVEAAFLYPRRDLGADPGKRLGFLNDDSAPGFTD